MSLRIGEDVPEEVMGVLTRMNNVESQLDLDRLDQSQIPDLSQYVSFKIFELAIERFKYQSLIDRICRENDIDGFSWNPGGKITELRKKDA